MKTTEHPEWFFMWIRPKGASYITRLCDWTKRGLKQRVENEIGTPWKLIYGRGGRLVKVRIQIIGV